MQWTNTLRTHELNKLIFTWNDPLRVCCRYTHTTFHSMCRSLARIGSLLWAPVVVYMLRQAVSSYNECRHWKLQLSLVPTFIEIASKKKTFEARVQSLCWSTEKAKCTLAELLLLVERHKKSAAGKTESNSLRIHTQCADFKDELRIDLTFKMFKYLLILSLFTISKLLFSCN